MDQNSNQVSFYVGEMNVSMDIVNGQAGDISGTDADGETYEGEFVFVRLSGGKCKICRRLQGNWECQDISCSVLDSFGSSEQEA